MFLMTLFQNPTLFIQMVVVVVFSVTLHELAHALAAWSQGDDTAVRAGRLTLNPTAHMSQSALVMLLLVGVTWGSTPVQESRFRYPLSSAFVSAAGPAANFLLVCLCVALQLAFGLWGDDSAVWMPSMARFLSMAAMLNAYLLLLNLLPIPPLDGFGILETLAPPLRRYRLNWSQYGFFALMVLFLFLGLGRFLSGLAWLLVESLSSATLHILQRM